MNKLKDWLMISLGTVGVVIYYVISLCFCFLPLQVLDAPMWVDFIIIFATFMLSEIGLPILWTVGLFYVIPSLSIEAIIYYVVFTFTWIPELIGIIIHLIMMVCMLFSKEK